MSQRTEFSKDFSKNKQRIDELLQIDKSFDLLYRVVIIGGKKACFYFVDGFCKDEIMEKVLEFLYKIKPEEMPETAHDFLNEKLPYGEIDLVRTENDLEVLIGCSAFDGGWILRTARNGFSNISGTFGRRTGKR